MKKVLVVTYYWPPAGGPGVQRWLKFVKYLRDFDIEPVVYVPENPDYPMYDLSLEQEIPQDIKILKKRIFEPYFLARLFSGKNTKSISSGIIPAEGRQNWLQRLMLYIRGNFFIPDARKYWIKPSVQFLSAYISENPVDLIITTGPPHSLHLTGLALKNKTGIKCLADFRDPWTQIGYHSKLRLTSASRKKHEDLERKVLREADHILTTSFTTKAEFEEKTRTPVSTITNGYEEYGLPEIQTDGEFSLAHIGSLLAGRNPVNLWRVLGELIRKNEKFAAHFKLKLAGALSEEVLKSIKDSGLEGHLELLGYVSHTEALKLQRKTRVLLLIEIDSEETRGIIPGKLFEYLAAKRPILSLGPDKWDVEKILRETNAGKVFSYSDEQILKDSILEYFEDYLKGGPEVEPENIEKYSRKNLTGDLAQLIKQILD